MGLLTFSINVTLDGCVDHQEGIADDETHAFFTRLMDEGGAMLWGRVTYEMMESYWPTLVKTPSGKKSLDDFAMAMENSQEDRSNTLEGSRRLVHPWCSSQRARSAGDRR